MRYLPNGAQMKAADTYTIEKVGIPSLVLMDTKNEVFRPARSRVNSAFVSNGGMNE